MIKFISNRQDLAPYTLHPISCTGSFELNGSWNIDMELLKDESACEHMEIDSTIVVDLPWAKEQRYSIYSIYADEDTVKVSAVPEWVWRATHQYIIKDSRPTNLNGLEALLYVLDAANATLTAQSNIQDTHTAYYINKNLMECISGEENSFLNLWGGEILYDNSKIIINESAGKDRGLCVRAGFNLTGWSITEDISNYADVIHPMAYNSQNAPIKVSRETIGKIPHNRFIKYEKIRFKSDCSENDLEDETLTICNTQEEMNEALRVAVQNDLDNGVFDPTYTYEIDFIDLSKTDQYKDYKDLLYLQLGDTLKVENLNRNITTAQKVVKIDFDFLSEEITTITLGSMAQDYFRANDSTLKKSEVLVKELTDSTTNTIVASKVKGMLLAANTQLKAQYDSATELEQTAVICENNDPNSMTYGCLAMGSAGIQLSTKKDPTGAWDFSTAITSEGIIADYIMTGLLTDKTGNFYFNLETGEFMLGNGVINNAIFKGEIDTFKDIKAGKDIILGATSSGEYAKGRIRLGNNKNDEKGSCIIFGESTSGDGVIITPAMEEQNDYFTIVNLKSSDDTVAAIRADTIVFDASAIAVTANKSGHVSGAGSNYTGSLSNKTVKIVNGLIVSIA